MTTSGAWPAARRGAMCARVRRSTGYPGGVPGYPGTLEPGTRGHGTRVPGYRHGDPGRTPDRQYTCNRVPGTRYSVL
eukprot:81292-Rhodomonas_salina.1